MLKKHSEKLGSVFVAEHVIFWSNLSRVNNLLVLMNISMFFLTGLVAQGYYYTIYSLICFGVVGLGALVPTTLIRKLWYYRIFLAIESTGFYFLVVSILYWVENGSV